MTQPAAYDAEDAERGGASVREMAARKIRACIVSGELLAGQRLPESELCALTGAARTTVREAVRQLESEGLITSIPHRGPVVAVLSEQEARDIYELRAMLEGQAARLFVLRASEAQVEALRRTVEDIGRAHDARDMVGVIDSSNEYYQVLTRGAGNATLAQAMLTIHNRLALFRFSSTRWAGRAERSMAELRAIADAVAARDPAAAALCSIQHVEAAADLALLLLAERARGAAAATRARFRSSAAQAERA